MATKKYNRKKGTLHSMIIGLLFITAVSCDKDLKAPTIPPLETGTLSASKATVVVDNDNPLDEAVSFSWAATKNSHITYKLVFVANDKSDTVDVSTEVSKKFTNVDFNTMLLDKFQLEIGKPADIQVTVHAQVVRIDNNNQKASSNVVTISATPDNPVEPPPAYTRLWIVGNATPNGWNINDPNVMINDPTNIYQFKYNEILTAGEFKIPVATGNWSGDFYMPPTNHPDLSSTSVTLIPGGNPDNKWNIENPGPYKILLNISSKPFIKITPFVPYTNVYILGNATTAGWDVNHPIAMMADAVDKNVFTWTGELSEGEFRFPISTGTLDGNTFVAPSPEAALNATQIAFTSNGAPANNFKVTAGQTGIYKITLNQFKETIAIVKQ